MQAIDGNLFDDILSDRQDEAHRELVSLSGVKIERIVSNGQASPADF